MDAHAHTFEQTFNNTHAQLGDVKHNAEVRQGHYSPGVFCDWAGCQGQAQGVGLHRAAWAC